MNKQWIENIKQENRNKFTHKVSQQSYVLKRYSNKITLDAKVQLKDVNMIK